MKKPTKHQLQRRVELNELSVTALIYKISQLKKLARSRLKKIRALQQELLGTRLSHGSDYR